MASQYSELPLYQYILQHPKIELHAHISGSIRETTLIDLIKNAFPDNYQDKLAICKLLPSNIGDTRDLAQCFDLFKVLHHVIRSLPILRRVTLEVLEDFLFRDNTCYIELRSTPRSFIDENGDIIFTKRQYIDTVLDAMIEFRQIICLLCYHAGVTPVVSVPYNLDINTYTPEGQYIINKYLYFISPHQRNIPLDSIPHDISPLLSHIDHTHVPTYTHYSTYYPTYNSIIYSLQLFVSCGILFSIDRSSNIDDAYDTLNIITHIKPVEVTTTIQTDTAIATTDTTTVTDIPISSEYTINTPQELLLGLDLSGNPYSKSFNYFKPVFEQARHYGSLYFSIHYAEVDNIDDSQSILSFRPDRLGHAAVLDQTLYNTMRQLKIPIEICLSSNKACRLHDNITVHPLVAFLGDNIENELSEEQGKLHQTPLVLCTDDSGVFSCSLTDEWLQLAHLAYFNSSPIPSSQSDHPPHEPSNGQYCLLSSTQCISSSECNTSNIIPSSISLSTNNNKISSHQCPHVDIHKARLHNFALLGVKSIFQRQYMTQISNVMDRMI